MMTKMIGAICIFLILMSPSLFGCDCNQGVRTWEGFQEAYHSSNTVVLGKVIEVKDNGFVFEVLESFKNSSRKTILEIPAINSCAFFPGVNTFWILYLTEYEGKLESSICQPNRKLGQFHYSENSIPGPNDSIDFSMLNYNNEELFKTFIHIHELRRLNQDILEKGNNTWSLWILIVLIVSLGLNVYLVLRRK